MASLMMDGELDGGRRPDDGRRARRRPAISQLSGGRRSDDGR